MNRRKDSCPNGHKYTEESSETTLITKRGSRVCRICANQKNKDKRAQETALLRQHFPKHNGPYRRDPEERFWEKVDIKSDNECWPWLASVKQRGYGCFWDGNKLAQAHRYSLELKLGRSLAKEEVTRHICDNPPCVNPNHLIVGSASDNHTDKVTRGRHHNAIKTHCPKGHKYDGIVTKKDGSKRRYCKKCKSDKAKERKAWQKQCLLAISTSQTMYDARPVDSLDMSNRY